MTASTNAQQLQIEPSEAETIIDAYFGRFAKVRTGLDNAVTSAVQGTATDIVGLAMTHLDRTLAASGLHASALLQVHDEVLERSDAHLHDTRQLVIDALSHAVPLEVDAAHGPCWYDAEKS